MKYLESFTGIVYYKKKKKTDDLIIAPKYFHWENILRTNWLVNLAKGLHKTNQHLEADKKLK